MPHSVSIDLPLVITCHGGHSLVRPIGFPEFALASSVEANAIRTARRRVVKACREYVGTQLIGTLVRGRVQAGQLVVDIAPPKKGPLWRKPIEASLPTFVWSQGDALLVTYLPTLDLTVVASPGTDVGKLVQEQVRSTIRRQDAWTLMGLAELDGIDEAKMRTERLDITLPTAVELARKNSEKPSDKMPTLKAVATRLNRKSLRPAYHREQEVELLAQFISGEHPRSVLLVGPSGVGKTAVFHEWVRIRNRWNMKHVQCWATDGSRLISGQTGFGMWQKQCLAMADEASKYPCVIHLGNLVELSESGRLRGSGGCGALLAPRLADGSLVGVIECTPEQLTRLQRTEPRLIAALTTLTIEEPSSEDTRSILLEAAAAWRPVDITAELKQKRKKLTGKKKRKARRAAERARLERPTVEPESLQVLDRLHRRFQTDAASPGRPLSFFHAVMSELGSGGKLDGPTVIEAFGRQTGLPDFLVDERVRPNLQRIQQKLSSQVLGQKEVIETLVDMVATLAADLSRGDRPLASLMLIGPTGVGKTETAKALARLIYSDVSRLVRIDMSELSGSSAVGRLIGDAVNPEGLLTAAVRAQPFSLVLLDEFEKAHPSVFDLLLQVLGEGRLTDGRGRVADFRNSIVLMTSNLGVDSFKAMPLGLADTQQQDRYRNHFQRQVRDFLRPEMFNRIDRILSYAPLPEIVVREIAEMRLLDVQQRDGWKHHGKDFQVAAGVVETLARDGYEPQYGARPLAREVERSVVLPLAEAICETGRNHPVDVKLKVIESADHVAKVTVQARSRSIKDKRQYDAVHSLIEEATLLRRRGQALQKCSAVRDLRNQKTSQDRRWRHLKAKERREAILSTTRGRYYQSLKQRLKQINQMGRDLNLAESDLLVRYYGGDPIDEKATSESVKKLRDRLWNTLCELQTHHRIDNQRIGLMMTGTNLSVARPLLIGYRALAIKRAWNLQVHALLPRDNDGTTDRAIDTDGWSSSPSFRVNTNSEQPIDEILHESLLGNLLSRSDSEDKTSKTNEESDSPKLAAYGLIRLSQLLEIPTGCLGLLLTFGGRATEIMMGGEAGVHTFRQGDRGTSTAITIQTHRGTPTEYHAPRWLAEHRFETVGTPRRGYDAKNKEVIDLSQDSSKHFKIDREGKWLEQAIEHDVERRIWAALDD